jgi:hypothetical protein
MNTAREPGRVLHHFGLRRTKKKYVFAQLAFADFSYVQEEERIAAETNRVRRLTLLSQLTTLVQFRVPESRDPQSVGAADSN